MKRLIRRHPLLSIHAVLTAAAALLLAIFRLSEPFSEGFAVTAGAFFRRGLAVLTGWFPFSLFEIVLAGFVLFVLFDLGLCVFALARRLKKKKAPRRLAACLWAVPVILGTVLQLFALTLGPCYFRSPVAKHMDLAVDSVTGEDVFRALEAVSDVLNEVSPLLEKNEAGETAGKPLAAVRDDVARAADAFAEKNDFFQRGGAAVKTFLSSPLMTYTHLSGVYGFFTGEANVNVNYPHFIVTATAAHETCHARGVAPENECNFLAAVILLESGDPYLRYCGAAFIFDDLAAACRKTDRERAEAVLASTDGTVFRDYAAYSRFFEPYRQSPAAAVADSANAAYLRSLGQKDGTVSYSRIIELVAAYFR